MKIAIDFDKTLFDCDSYLYQIVNRILPNICIEPVTYTPLSCVQEKENLISKLYYKLFNFTHADKYTEYKNAVNSIKDLKQHGHEIIILSSRPIYQLTVMPIKDLTKLYDMDEKDIIINCNNKVQFCKQHNVDLIIDNDIKVCKKAILEGIDAICFTNETYPNMKTCHSWSLINECISNLYMNEKISQNS